MARKHKLIPADPAQCQAEVTTYRPFVMGGKPHKSVRCSNKPVFIVTQTKPAEDDGQMGSMSMCAECFIAFARTNKVNDFDLQAVA